jgi:1,4-dihydroxy-2-naphthoyl-CoA hydrolase
MENVEAERLKIVALDQPPFARHIDIRLISATPDRVEGQMNVNENLGNRNGVLHGGALMGFADNIGGTASFLNLKDGEGTTTIESKTNFFRAISIGDVATAVCVPLHKGRKTLVCQTTITRGDGKVAAIVVQTQMILKKGD